MTRQNTLQRLLQGATDVWNIDRHTLCRGRGQQAVEARLAVMVLAFSNGFAPREIHQALGVPMTNYGRNKCSGRHSEMLIIPGYFTRYGQLRAECRRIMTVATSETCVHE